MEVTETQLSLSTFDILARYPDQVNEIMTIFAFVGSNEIFELAIVELLENLSEYPHILKEIAKKWKTPEFDSYINSIVNPIDDKERKGFSLKTLLIISEIQQLHAQMFPNMGTWDKKNEKIGRFPL